MRLVLKEYLMALRERNELDVLLPELLGQMGFNVFSRPSIGTRQYGVDIAAVGTINKKKSLYLFTVKSGNLDRDTWDGKNQDLRPSLNEIIDVYIESCIPLEFKKLPIVIAICIGGEIEESVKLNLDSFIKKESTNNISFETWTSDVLVQYIEKFLLNEAIIQGSDRGGVDVKRLLRKSLAMIDSPKIATQYFDRLTRLLTDQPAQKKIMLLQNLRKLHLSIWVLYAWSREEDNLECAYLSCEYALLKAWDIAKISKRKKNKTDENIRTVFDKILQLFITISEDYSNKIIKYSSSPYMLSAKVGSNCSKEINLKLFDVLGRVALLGLWKYWQYAHTSDKLSKEAFINEIKKYEISIKNIIVENPILVSPYSDAQAIEISLVFVFLAKNQENRVFIAEWMDKMIKQIIYLFDIANHYPCIFTDYRDLYDHPKNSSKEYFEEATKASILYPTLLLISAICDFSDMFDAVKEIQKKILPHCTFQIWYPDDTSEIFYYNNSDLHGLTNTQLFYLGDIGFLTGSYQNKTIFLEKIFNIMTNAQSFEKLSAVEFGYSPLLLLASRHYRLPVPTQFMAVDEKWSNKIWGTSILAF